VGYAKVALDELDRVERSISHLLRFAREEEIEVRELRLADVVESALETFRDRIERLGVRVESEIDTEGSMRGDVEKLRRVVINLLGNALDALEESGTEDPVIRMLAGENLAGTELWLRVRDNGPGIDPEALHKIFSPFYTSKSIEAHSAPGNGTEFVLTFPKQTGNAGA
jgi:C4-dicarboxylate-specific signal transduction histidine kinase